jgi:tetratricopeptide (TPR) repeat protein
MAESNSVFISYRREASAFVAQAVFQDLQANGIDAFYDIESINSGQFDTIILNQIAARPYFLPILTPGALDRCTEADDWVLREIEHAVALKREIVPLYTPDFKTEDIAKYLPGPLASELKRYNAVEIPHRYFKYAMQDVRARFLRPVELSVTPTPKAEEAEVKHAQEQAAAKPVVTEKELTAAEYFEKATIFGQYQEYDKAVEAYTQGLRLNPDYSYAYLNRGAIYDTIDELDKALADYNQAIQLNPYDAVAFNNRGSLLGAKGEYDTALQDFDKSVALDPRYAYAYSNRGEVQFIIGQYQNALVNFQKANELKRGDKFALAGMAISFHALGNLSEAQRDWKSLVGRDKRYKDVEWVRRTLRWANPLVEEARKLIAEL